MADPLRSRRGPRDGPGAPSLTEAGRPLDPARLLDRLAGEPLVRDIVLLESTGSTNDDARRLAADGAAEGLVVVAGRQTGGRGRLGRAWHSPPGVGLYLSIVLRPARPSSESTRWAIAAAAAACAACRALGAPAATVKWPNDVLASGRKLAGILVEARTAGASLADLVVGIGLNVSHAERDFPPDLRIPATSLRIESGASVGLERAAAEWLRRFGPLHRMLAAAQWDPVADAWLALAPAARGARVRFAAPGAAGSDLERGVTDGLDPSGALRIRRDDGSFSLVRDAESVVAWEP